MWANLLHDLHLLYQVSHLFLGRALLRRLHRYQDCALVAADAVRLRLPHLVHKLSGKKQDLIRGFGCFCLHPVDIVDARDFLTE